jgi:hypothetical protein
LEDFCDKDMLQLLDWARFLFGKPAWLAGKRADHETVISEFFTPLKLPSVFSRVSP